jgi:hypothetical protein
MTAYPVDSTVTMGDPSGITIEVHEPTDELVGSISARIDGGPEICYAVGRGGHEASTWYVSVSAGAFAAAGIARQQLLVECNQTAAETLTRLLARLCEKAGHIADEVTP